MKFICIHQKIPHIFAGVTLICLLPLAGFAQNARLRLDNLEKLSSKASSVNQVALEGDTLQLAVNFLDGVNDADAAQAKEIIKRLKGIYVRNFEFNKANQYSAEDMQEIHSQLAAPGWTKIVENREKETGETNEIYLMKDEETIIGVAILAAEPKELTVVNIVGPIDLAKLGTLAGKLGGLAGKIAIPTDKKPGLKNRPSGQPSHE
jgi:hypothetical protein